MTEKNSSNFYTMTYLTALFTSVISLYLSYLFLYELPFTFLLDIGLGYWFVLALKNAICLAILSLTLSFVWAIIMLKDNFYHYDSSNLFLHIIKVKYTLIFILHYIILSVFNDTNNYPITYTLIFLCIIFYSLSIYFLDFFRNYHDDEKTDEAKDQNDQSFRNFRKNLEKEKFKRLEELKVKLKQEKELERKLKRQEKEKFKRLEEQKIKIKQEEELKKKLESIEKERLKREEDELKRKKEEELKHKEEELKRKAQELKQREEEIKRKKEEEIKRKEEELVQQRKEKVQYWHTLLTQNNNPFINNKSANTKSNSDTLKNYKEFITKLSTEAKGENLGICSYLLYNLEMMNSEERNLDEFKELYVEVSDRAVCFVAVYSDLYKSKLNKNIQEDDVLSLLVKGSKTIMSDLDKDNENLDFNKIGEKMVDWIGNEILS